MDQYVCIFMATYNGAAYIEEQLQSIANQTIKNWELVVSDDGSSDNTLEIIQSFKLGRTDHRITIKNGPQLGFASNFMSMVNEYNGKANFFAFSDQDDIWNKNKLERAVLWLKNVDSNTPALYCARTEFVNQYGQPFSPKAYSKLFVIKPCFENSLLQCIGGGNTMVFNKKAFELILKAKTVKPIPSHDWWLYQLVTGAGGIVYYDPQPCLLYRQHSDNLVGGNTSIMGRISRALLFFKGVFASKNRDNITNLNLNDNLLEARNKLVLNLYSKACSSTRLHKRVLYFLNSNARRQSSLENIIIFIGLILNKL